MLTKKCSDCKETKEVAFFYTHKRDGYQSKCKECASKRGKEWFANNPDKVRRNTLKYYGITQEDFEALFKEQQGKCAICLTESKKILNVDHCHTTGKVRGLLCFSCNTLLGTAKDSVKTLNNAIKYLERYNGY